MEQIYNALMAKTQTTPDRPSSTSGGDKEGFQKLMDQKGSANASESAQGTQGPQQPTEGTTPVQEAGPVAAQDPKELEKQMALAAMAVVQQNPQIAELVADIAEETPQILTDPAWEEGFVPIGYTEGEDFRIVHWMHPEAAAEVLEENNDLAAKWAEAMEALQTGTPVAETQTAPEIPVQMAEEAPEVLLDQGGDVTEDLLPKEAPAESAVFGEVEAVPVQVGEAPAAAEQAQAEDVGNQIGPWISSMIDVMDSNGSRLVTIHLEPENLGKVQIQMNFNKDGSLHLVLNAEHRSTLDLLARHSEQLSEILGKYARSDVQVEVPRQQESQRQDLLNQQQQQNQHHHQQERRKDRRESGEDFLHQLRLGLIPGEEI